MSAENEDYLPPTRTPWNEGKTLAAWATTWVILVGGVVVAVGMMLPSTPLIVVGAVIMIGSLVLGRVLAILGHGKNGRGTVERDRKALSQGRAH